MRNTHLLLIALFAFTILGASQKANAQAAFAGSYGMVGGYSSGFGRGLYYQGTATATRTGAVAYTAYFPWSGYPTYGMVSSGTGTISAAGRFSFTTRGLSGAVQLLLQKYGLGIFSDSWGSGYFALLRS